jgi:hypothetical protein
MTGDDLGDRQKDDFYATPAWVTSLLWRAEPFFGDVWEPAAGTGLISELLKARGATVVSTDLVDRGYADAQTGIDFLMEQRLLAPNVITNPPFKLAREFAQHAMDLGAAKCALLLKLAFMQGGDRTPWLFSSGLRRVHVISKRITFVAAPDRPAFTSNFVDGYGWFVWQSGYRGSVELLEAS